MFNDILASFLSGPWCCMIQPQKLQYWPNLADSQTLVADAALHRGPTSNFSSDIETLYWCLGAHKVDCLWNILAS